MEKSITIDAETARKMALNAEANLRQTVYGEATQHLNPITGRPYEDQYFVDAEEKRILRELDSSTSQIYSSPRKIENSFKIIYENPYSFTRSVSPRTTPLIEMQIALARMNVREGEMSEFEYMQFLADLNTLSDSYRQTDNLTLRSITDGNGLNVALSEIEYKREMNRIIKEPEYRIYSSKNLPKYIDDHSRTIAVPKEVEH